MNRTILLDTQHHALSATREGFSHEKCCRRVADVANVAFCGALVELVYTPVLGTGIFGYESSSLLRPTNLKYSLSFFTFTFFDVILLNLNETFWLPVRSKPFAVCSIFFQHVSQKPFPFSLTKKRLFQKFLPRFNLRDVK